jgi:NtrC-family two-component system sensor histidine kinase KinB
MRASESVARLRDVALETALGSELPAIRADPRMVERMIDNLLGNAIKFSPPGKCVRIETARRGERVAVSVRDQGKGIKPEERANLFRRYSVLSRSRRDSSGLGLFIVKTLADAHGAEVAVDCPPEGGSVFAVAFPIAGSRQG